MGMGLKPVKKWPPRCKWYRPDGSGGGHSFVSVIGRPWQGLETTPNNILSVCGDGSGGEVVKAVVR